MGCFDDQAAATLAAHDFFAPGHPVWIARAPGRLDVMGGNVDYTGGMVLQGLLREAVWIACQPRTDDTIRILNPEASTFGWLPHFELPLNSLRDTSLIQAICTEAEGSYWGRYVLGAIHFLQLSYPSPGRSGLDLFLHSTLPPNKGVSSSAALTIAALKAASAAWNLELAGVSLATAGQWVENVVAGAACGIMDQAAIVLGRQDHLLPLICQPCLPSPVISLPDDVCFWGIDSMAARSTTGAAYETARAAAFMGYRMICHWEDINIVPDPHSSIPRWTDTRWKGYLSNLAPSEFRARFESWLPESMEGSEFLAEYGEHVDPFTTVDPEGNYPVRAAVRYAVEENFRVQTVSTLLQATAAGSSESTLRLIGEILFQSHLAYSECGLGSEACDELVDRARKAGLYGAKMTGGGAGGVVALLGRPEDRQKVFAIAEDYGRARGKSPYVFEGSSDGVGAFGVRVLQLDAFGVPVSQTDFPQPAPTGGLR